MKTTKLPPTKENFLKTFCQASVRAKTLTAQCEKEKDIVRSLIAHYGSPYTESSTALKVAEYQLLLSFRSSRKLADDAEKTLDKLGLLKQVQTTVIDFKKLNELVEAGKISETLFEEIAPLTPQTPSLKVEAA